MDNTVFKAIGTKVLKRYVSVLNGLIEASKNEFDPPSLEDHSLTFLFNPFTQTVRARDVDQFAREFLRSHIQEELKQRQEHE